jgi:hypothetical protein
MVEWLAPALFWRWLLGGGLAVGLLLTAILLASADYSFVNLPTTLLPDGVSNPFTSWEADKNCVYTHVKAFAWLNSLVAASIPVLAACSCLLPAPSTALFCAPDIWTKRFMPSLLRQHGWTLRSMAVLVMVVAANAIGFALPARQAYQRAEDGEDPYWVESLPEGSAPVRESVDFEGENALVWVTANIFVRMLCVCMVYGLQHVQKSHTSARDHT